jgi:ABC-type spermidine/putrescine transport system permease subunit I
MLSAPAVALLCGVVLTPAVLLVRVSLCEPAAGRGFYTPGTFTLQHYARLFDPHHRSIVAFTVGFAIAVTAVSLVVGYPLALFIRSRAERWQPLAVGLVLLPKTAGTLAALFGLQRLLPRGLIAAVLTEAYLIAPYVMLVLVVQLRAIDPTLLAAARGLGANRWQAFWRVTLPLSWPGVILATEFGLAWGIGALAGPLFLGGTGEHTLAAEVQRQAFEYGRWPQAAADAVGLAILALLVLALVRVRRSP